MNGKRLILIVSLLIIIVGGTVLLLRFIQKETHTESRGITEEDYKENPKYILEELIVSNGKHFEYPQVENVWVYTYATRQPRATGVLELTEQAYNDVIKQLDEELKVDRFENSEYKDKVVSSDADFLVDGNYGKTDFSPEEQINLKWIFDSEAEVEYIMKVPDYKYQTRYKGEMMIHILMTKKYETYYMSFVYCHRLDMFSPYS